MAILKNLVIAVTGSLEHENTQLKKWIEANDGRYSPSVRKGVTHLIAGQDAWKKSSDAVQAATKLGAFVVKYDWLEDSLQKKRKLAETRYTWEYLWQEKKKRKRLARVGLLADAKKFNDGCEEAKKATGTGTSKSRSRTVSRKPKQSKSFFFGDVANVPFVSAADDLKQGREEREAAQAKKAKERNVQAKTGHSTSAPPAAQPSTSAETVCSASSTSSHTLSAASVSEAPAKKPSLKDLYHYYLDTTGFEYKITLTRCNLRANQISRYRLSILESHTKPHVYCTFVEYFPPSTAPTPAANAACIQALLDFNATFEPDTPDPDNHSPTPAPDPPAAHPEATRLTTLLHPPPPSASLPYKTLLTPLSSPFPPAFHAFRTAFRDLTLLAWEERFDTIRTLYKQRAARFQVEPFVYVRPGVGLPLGLQTQGPVSVVPAVPAQEGGADGRSGSQTGGAQTPGAGAGARARARAATDPNVYVYPTFRLPALAHPLGTGIIGSALRRDADAALKAATAAQAAQQAAQQAAEAADKATRGRAPLSAPGPAAAPRRPDFKRPLFNGVTGVPEVDAWGRRTGFARGGGHYNRGDAGGRFDRGDTRYNRSSAIDTGARGRAWGGSVRSSAGGSGDAGFADLRNRHARPFPRERGL